ncbi:MAG: methyltransferase family protein [Chitinophagales bacterium]
MPLQEEMEKQGNFLFRYRGSLPLVLLVVACIVFVNVAKTSVIPCWFPFVCFAISCLGLITRIYTVGHTPKNTSGRNTKEQIADEVNTTGIYSTVRHPLYVGNFFMWLGAGMLTYHFWFILFFVAFYWIYYERIMFAEEQFLRKKFGELYTSWAQNTPAFIPAFSKFIPPKYPFSMKKVLRKEVNGFMNVFIVFAIFDLIGFYILHNSFGIENYFWVGGFATCLVAYLIIKILSKNTKLVSDASRV